MTNEPSLSPRRGTPPPPAVATTPVASSTTGLEINTDHQDTSSSSSSITNSPSSPHSTKLASPNNTNNITKAKESASVSPISTSSTQSSSELSTHELAVVTNTKPQQSLKRNRDNSLENSTSSSSALESDLDRRNLSTSSSPQPPPTKTAKTSSSSYSIMNLLGKESASGSSSSTVRLNKENSEERAHSPVAQLPYQFGQPDFSALLQQQAAAAAAAANGAQLNPFMMNPFLAAAAALQNSAGQAGAQTTPNLLNNISNLAMLSNLNSKSEGQFWPWLNMAAMSALYNAGGSGASNQESKFKFFIYLFERKIENFLIIYIIRLTI